jgi:hypothetical protein
VRRQRASGWLPYAVLGPLFALVVAVGLPSTAPATSVGASHLAVTAGHLSEGLLALAHARTVLHLPAALPADASPARDGLVRPATTASSPTLPSLAAIPPTAIRGPPA